MVTQPSLFARTVRSTVLTIGVVLLASGHARLQVTGTSPVITEASIRGHMELLASDAMNGRGDFTRDEWIAATYMGSQMRAWGLEPLGDNGGYVQRVEVRRVPAPGTRSVSTWNALGKLTGSDAAQSAEVILLTAHLDHLGNRATATTPPGTDTIYNGADDDASGSTAVLELAEAIARGPRPKRTVIFAWFGNEENGGAGARHFLDQPPVPLDRIVANLEFEMIGRADAKVKPHELWLTGYERSNLGPELARQGALLVADPHPDQKFFQRSDNIQLACQGVIAQTVSSFGLHKDYHQPSDEISTIDFAHMTEAIQSMYAPVMWLANSSFTPEWLQGKKPGPGNGCR
jgi:hypothetical protein